jgi:hypothetical protein
MASAKRAAKPLASTVTDLVKVEPEVIAPVPKKAHTRAWSQKRGVITAAKKPTMPSKSIEGMVQREMFEKYLAMGEERSVLKLALETGRSSAVLSEWSRKYNWVKRVLAIEEEYSSTIGIEPVADQIEKRKFGLRLIDKILRNTVTLHADGSIDTCAVEAKSPSDIRTLLILRDELLHTGSGSKTFGKGSQINAENAVFIIKK